MKDNYFCCEYNRQRISEKYNSDEVWDVWCDCMGCECCPILWGSEEFVSSDLQCLDKTYSGDLKGKHGIIGVITDRDYQKYFTFDKNKCAVLAREIANLPERKGEESQQHE